MICILILLLGVFLPILLYYHCASYKNKVTRYGKPYAEPSIKLICKTPLTYSESYEENPSTLKTTRVFIPRHSDSAFLKSIEVWFPHGTRTTYIKDQVTDPFSSSDSRTDEKDHQVFLRINVFVQKEDNFVSLLHHPITIDAGTPARRMHDFSSLIKPSLGIIEPGDVLVVQREYSADKQHDFPNFVSLGWH